MTNAELYLAARKSTGGNYVTKSELTAAIAAVNSLKRKIVNSISDIDVTSDDADNYIYMVLRSAAQTNNIYDEYMVISGKIEILGTTEIDLSDYVKNTDYATTSAPGIMTAADKTKLNGIATGANKTTVDTALSSTSTNPVQNKVVNTALNGKSNTNHTHSQYYSSDDNTSGTLTLSLATGASGDYCTMADKAVEVGIVGTFAPTATGSATVTTIPFSFSKSKSFICHDMTNNVPLEATLSKTGELKVNFKSTGSQRIVLHETFIM